MIIKIWEKNKKGIFMFQNVLRSHVEEQSLNLLQN